MEYEDFVQKYIPNNFDESLLHKDKIEFLKKIKFEQNLLFYGYEGKRILINLYLKTNCKQNKLKKTTTIINNIYFNYYHSDNHIEFNINDLNKDEIKILIHFIKFYSSTKSILNLKKIIIIYNFNNLSFKEQYKFRTIIEKMSNVRFIFHVSKLSKVIEPLLSRFLLIRLPIISENERNNLIKFIFKDNNSKFNNIKNLIEISKKNGILSLKTLLVNIYIKICNSSYRIKNIDTKKLLLLILSNKHPFIKIDKSKELINEYIVNHMKIIEIYKNLYYNVINNNDISNNLKVLITKKTSYYESLYVHNRNIIMLETYIAFLVKTFNNC